MTILTVAQASDLAQRAGFTGAGLALIVAIAQAESGLDTNAVNLVKGGVADASRDRGIMQINSYWHPEVIDACAFEPLCAFAASYGISKRGTNFSPWTTYKNGAYLKFLRSNVMSSSVDYPGATNMLISDPAWIFTDALVGVPNADLTIVNHKTANGGPVDAQGIAHFFANDTSGHKSAHFVVGLDGEVVQVVQLKDGAGANCCLEAGHDGYWDRLVGIYGNLNRCTISIEHVDETTDNSQPMPPAQVLASHKLNLWLVQKYQLLPSQIKGHHSLDPLSRARCPGPTFSFPNLLNYISTNGQPPIPTVLQFTTQELAVWNTVIHGLSTTTGIAQAWATAWRKPPHRVYGPPLTSEFSVPVGKNTYPYQVFTNAVAHWDGATAIFESEQGKIV